MRTVVGLARKSSSSKKKQGRLTYCELRLPSQSENVQVCVRTCSCTCLVFLPSTTKKPAVIIYFIRFGRYFDGNLSQLCPELQTVLFINASYLPPPYFFGLPKPRLTQKLEIEINICYLPAERSLLASGYSQDL